VEKAWGRVGLSKGEREVLERRENCQDGVLFADVGWNSSSHDEGNLASCWLEDPRTGEGTTSKGFRWFRFTRHHVLSLSLPFLLLLILFGSWDNMLEYRKRFRGRPAEEYNMPYNPNPRTSQMNATDFFLNKKDWGEAWQKNWRNVALRTWPDILDRNLRVQATNWNNLHMPERNYSSLSNWSG
jgi:hypothetical protein